LSHIGQTIAEPVRAPEGGFLALMRYRNYALLWTGQLISQTGDRFHWVAISLWVYAQTGSALSVSYAIMALTVGPALVGLFAGAFVDRFDKRRILIYSDIVRAVLVLAIPSLMRFGLVWVYADLFLISIASAFFRPAMFAAIPQSLPRSRLLQANAFFASMDTSTEVFGPILAGLIIVHRGYSAALYIDALSYVLSALLVRGLRLGTNAPSSESLANRSAPKTLEAIREGFRYIRNDGVQVALLAFLLASYWVAGLNSLRTALAKGVLSISDGQFGWLQSFEGIGFVVASLLLGWYGGRIFKGQAIVLSYALWALAAAAIGLSTNYVMLLGATFWVGFSNMIVFVGVTTIIMERTPSDKIGRVVTTRQVFVALIRVVALVGFGWIADSFGIREAIVLMAGISLAGTVGAAIRYPALWRYSLGRLRPLVDKSEANGPILAENGATGIVKRFLEGQTSPEFVVSEQKSLSFVTSIITIAGLLLLFATLPLEALGLVVAIAGAVVAAVVVRFAGRRFRPSSGDPEILGS